MAETSPPTPPPASDPGRGAPEPGGRAPAATRDDLRGLRRWVLVAAVWAVAATAVALIALLDSSGDDDAKRQADEAAGGISQLQQDQRELGNRLDELESSIEDVPQAADVSRLQSRLGRAEDRGAAAADRARSANDRAAELADRLDQLEDDVAAQGDGGGGSTPDADGSGPEADQQP